MTIEPSLKINNKVGIPDGNAVILRSTLQNGHRGGSLPTDHRQFRRTQIM